MMDKDAWHCDSYTRDLNVGFGGRDLFGFHGNGYDINGIRDIGVRQITMDVTF